MRYWHAYLADFHRQLYTGHAVIRLSGNGVRRMRQLFSAAAETVGAADADGWVRARVPIESADQALADFLRLGADIEILEPAGLREQAARTIQAMAAIYASPLSAARPRGAACRGQ
jgi:predicted DNA-binding transcriptional regulator YafY